MTELNTAPIGGRLPALLAIIAGAAFMASAHVHAATGSAMESRDDFIQRMQSQHQFDTGWLAALLEAAEVKQSILDAISRPAEKTKPWHEYRKIFVNESRIAGGVEFWREHRQTLERVAADSGVEPQMIVAILGVETRYGRHTGNYRVLDALNTLAFEYPPRARFFRSELEQFLLLTREEAVDPLSATGSYAGAMGAPQFISSSYRRFAVDSSGDGRRDLWNDWADVIGSVGNYFNHFGWQRGQPVAVRAHSKDAFPKDLLSDPLKLSHDAATLRQRGVSLDASIDDCQRTLQFALDGQDGDEYWVGFKNFYVITRYNRSRMYALAAHQLADAIAERMNVIDE